MQFSDTINRTGLIEMLEDRTGTQSATGTSYPLKTKTRDINQAVIQYDILAKQYSKNWKHNDVNNTKDPLYKFNLVSGTATYDISTDGTNMIEAIDRVEVLDSGGIGIRLQQINRDTIDIGMTEFYKTAGTPQFYDLVGTKLTFYPAPNYNSTNGGRVFNEIEPYYFLSTDTTKVAGIPSVHHEYLILRPAYFYCATKGLPQAKFLQIELQKMEEQIKTYFESRNKDDTQYLNDGSMRVGGLENSKGFR